MYPVLIYVSFSRIHDNNNIYFNDFTISDLFPPRVKLQPGPRDDNSYYRDNVLVMLQLSLNYLHSRYTVILTIDLTIVTICELSRTHGLLTVVFVRLWCAVHTTAVHVSISSVNFATIPVGDIVVWNGSKLLRTQLYQIDFDNNMSNWDSRGASCIGDFHLGDWHTKLLLTTGKFQESVLVLLGHILSLSFYITVVSHIRKYFYWNIIFYHYVFCILTVSATEIFTTPAIVIVTIL